MKSSSRFFTVWKPAPTDIPVGGSKKINKKKVPIMKNPQQYTSAAKDWWQKNSDNLPGVIWDTFTTIWMAALNSPDTESSGDFKKKSAKLQAEIEALRRILKFIMDEKCICPETEKSCAKCSKFWQLYNDLNRHFN